MFSFCVRTLHVSYCSLFLTTPTPVICFELVLSHEVINNYNGYFVLIWISIIAITLVNGIIVLLMNGVREARNDSCSSKHFLINNTIAYPLMILFTTLLWIALAAYGFGVVVNGDFCGVSTNDSVLDLIGAMGYEFSMFHYYAQVYMEVSRKIRWMLIITDLVLVHLKRFILSCCRVVAILIRLRLGVTLYHCLPTSETALKMLRDCKI